MSPLMVTPYASHIEYGRLYHLRWPRNLTKSTLGRLSATIMYSDVAHAGLCYMAGAGEVSLEKETSLTC